MALTELPEQLEAVAAEFAMWSRPKWTTTSLAIILAA